MDRLQFTRSLDIQLYDGVLDNKLPELIAMYHLVDVDKYKVKGHLLEDELSFTVFCNKDEAVCISNRVQNHTMELYGKQMNISYNIHKNGIDLFII